jgi:BirA family biotin operon repressor/biotin-[acetyl-CoA-carboxylase] ligase
VHDVGLKWPNDVLLQGGKLAGILLEAQGDMLGPSAVVIGIGMNLSLPPQVQQIDQAVSDLAMCSIPLKERNRVLGVLLRHLVDMLEEFALGGFAPLRGEWEKYHVLQQRAAKLHMPDGTWVEGVVQGATDAGALRLQTAQGEQVFNSGEISLRSA